MRGQYAPIPTGDDRVFAFARWSGEERLFVISNFDGKNEHELVLEVPAPVITSLKLGSGCWALDEQLYGEGRNAMVVDHGIGKLHVRLAPYESLVYKTGGGMTMAPENDLTMVAPADPVCAAVLTQRLKHKYDDKL